MYRNFGICEQRPKQVVSITTPKKGTIHNRWLLLSPRDNDCDLQDVLVHADGDIDVMETKTNVAYADLWQAVGDMLPSKGKVWLLTLDAKNVLRKSKWLQALAEGTIELARQRKLSGKQKESGAVTFGQALVELDLVVDGGKVKLLDWSNFGVECGQIVNFADDYGYPQTLHFFHQWIISLLKIDVPVNRTSAAQLGWSKLRRSVKGTTFFTALDDDWRKLERRCYYGGRNEVYRTGTIKGKCYYVDINACYAAICSRLSVPVQPFRMLYSGKMSNGILLGKGQFYAADCIIEDNAQRFPVRHAGSVIYPTGKFATSLCGMELKSAVASGAVKKITRLAQYAAVPALVYYADWYTDAKQLFKGSDAEVFLPSLKCAFNSSLGFFARMGREWLPWAPAGADDWWFGITTDPGDPKNVVSAHTLSGSSEWLSVGSEQRNASPIVHAAICAAARAQLHGLTLLAGRQNVYYVDTDGLIVNQAGLDSLKRAGFKFTDDAGCLSIRWKADSCTINGPKNYRIGDHVVCAGLRKDCHGQWKPLDRPDVTSGVVRDDGTVAPFTMSCEDVGGESERWVNRVEA